MEAKIDQLASSITSLIRSFLQTEVGEYRENYEYMLNSPLCRKLLGEIDRLKKENQVLSSQERPNIELEIMEEVESPYEFDRKYKDDTRVSTKFAQIKPKEQVPEEVEVPDEEDGLGDASQEEEKAKKSVTDQEEGTGRTRMRKRVLGCSRRKRKAKRSKKRRKKRVWEKPPRGRRGRSHG